MFYKPSGYKAPRRDVLDMIDQDEKGTFYKKFTNTRILNMMP